MKAWQHLKEWLRYKLELLRLFRDTRRLTGEIWRLEDIEREVHSASAYLHYNDAISNKEMLNLNDSIIMRIRALKKERHANAIHVARLKLQMHKRQADR